MEILKGLPVANAINEKLMEQVKSIEGPLPHLAIIRVGERPDDCSYERGAVKKMDKVGVRCTTYTFDADIDNDTFQAEFDKINENPDIDGILMLRPLPKQLDEKQIENKIDPRKDLDGISPLNLAKVYAGDESGYAPCTAEAVIEMLDYAGIDIKGKRVTVVGRSLVIGKPVSMLLMKRNATVTVCHTKTVDMAGTCKNAEISQQQQLLFLVELVQLLHLCLQSILLRQLWHVSCMQLVMQNIVKIYNSEILEVEF